MNNVRIMVSALLIALASCSQPPISVNLILPEEFFPTTQPFSFSLTTRPATTEETVKVLKQEVFKLKLEVDLLKTLMELHEKVYHTPTKTLSTQPSIKI